MELICSTGVALLLVGGCWSAPLDEPVRVDLPVYDQPELGSSVQLTQHVEPGQRDGEARSDHAIVTNLITHKLHAASTVLGHKLSQNYAHEETAHWPGGYFSPPVTSLDGVLLETEGLGSKKLSIKENLHGIVAGLLQPKPIVDTIREDEKYGNTGDKFYGAGRVLVSGAEGVSNLVSSVLEVPGTIFRKIAKMATEKLNNLGGKLIGL